MGTLLANRSTITTFLTRPPVRGSPATKGRRRPCAKSVTFFSEGVRLAGDLYLPDDLARGEKRAGIVLCHGYTGVRNLYLFLPPLLFIAILRKS
jgi:hypothetical protein